jgi:hypothetical protein
VEGVADRHELERACGRLQVLGACHFPAYGRDAAFHALAPSYLDHVGLLIDRPRLDEEEGQRERHLAGSACQVE